MPKIDAPEIKSAAPVVDKVWVEVPEKDLFDLNHADILINGHKYAPGKHFVSVELAGEITMLVNRWRKQQIRLLQPTRDSKALGVVDHRGGSSVHPDSF